MSETERPQIEWPVLPGQRPRLKPVPWQDLDEAQKAIYQSVVGTRAIAVEPNEALPGPFNAMLYSPDVGEPLQRLGAALRSTLSIPARAREIATLAVATHFESEYEWFRHSAIARRLGVTDAELQALRRGEDVEFADPKERSALTVTRLLLRDLDLDEVEYRNAVEQLGEYGVVTLSTLVGYYTLLAMQLRLFRVPMPREAGASTEDAKGAPR